MDVYDYGLIKVTVQLGNHFMYYSLKYTKYDFNTTYQSFANVIHKYQDTMNMMNQVLKGDCLIMLMTYHYIHMAARWQKHSRPNQDGKIVSLDMKGCV